MGEAKRRRINAPKDFSSLDAFLRDWDVDTGRFGFYDQKEFIVHEQRNPEFLELYGKWVMQRPRDAEYDEHVRAVVPKLGKLLLNALERDGFQRGCVAASGMMSRMLDRLGVWSFAVGGSTVRRQSF